MYMDMHYSTTTIRVSFCDDSAESIRETNYTKSIDRGLPWIWYNTTKIKVFQTCTYHGRFMIRFMINDRKDITFV